ncbi:MAG: sensor histidine kinase [Minisyncoccota bacterium]
MAQSILSGVLSFVAEGVIVFTSEGILTLVNPHASLLLDHTSDELIGKRIDDMFALTFDSHPLKDTERITHTLFTAKKVFTVPHDKTAYLTPRSGSRFPIFVSARLLEFENETVGILVFRDISKEKKLESYKNETAKRLSALTPFLQRIATGDFSKTPEIPLEEDEFTELLVGLHLMTEDLQEAKIQHEEYSKQLEKQVEEKTREVIQAKTHIEVIIENLASGLIEYDDQFTLLRINRAAETLLGVDRTEVVGKQIRPEDANKQHWQGLVSVLYPAPSAVKKAKDVVAEPAVEANEMVIHYPLERELQIMTVPIPSQTVPKRQGFIKLVRDITREKNISRSKSEFISIAAHQLRTPLSAIKWTLDMVLGGDEGPLGSSQSKLLRSSYETNERMIQLVNDLLNVARIEEGRFGYEFKQADIMTVIQNAVEFVKVTAHEKNVAVSVETPDGKPPLFVFDASKVTLALQNLVDNAVKYTPEGGKVSLKIGVQGDDLEVEVKDTGIGIPKSQVNQLFTKFFRADNALRMQTSGSGMGLYLAKNIAIRHGGSLLVESKEGEGSTFLFRLPLQESRIPKNDVSLEGV